jgi:Type IV secretion-system coupling protein DNA-binding domain
MNTITLARNPIATVRAAAATATNLLLLGGQPAQRIDLLSAALDQIDQRDEAAFIYDPSGLLTRLYFLQISGDLRLAPKPLPRRITSDQRHALYRDTLTNDSPTALRLLQPAPNPTWNIADWLANPTGWVFLTHQLNPTPLEITIASLQLTALVYRIADPASRPPGPIWLVLDEPPFQPATHRPFVPLQPAFSQSLAALNTVLTLNSTDLFDRRYGLGSAETFARHSHTTLVLNKEQEPTL